MCLHKYGEKTYKEEVIVKGNHIKTRVGYIKKCLKCGKEKFEVFYFNERKK
jgi:hypothetical protein